MLSKNIPSVTALVVVHPRQIDVFAPDGGFATGPLVAVAREAIQAAVELAGGVAACVSDGDIALDLESAGGDATLALGAIVTVLGDHGFHAQVIHVEDCQACDQAQERRGDCAMCGGSFYVPLGPTPDPQGNA